MATPGASGAVPPGGTVAVPPNPMATADGSTTPPPVATELARTTLATRISRSEFANSVFDVLGVKLTEAELDDPNGGLPADSSDGVFKRFGDKQNTVEQHASGFFNLAQLAIERANVTQLVAGYKTCAEATLACALPVVTGLGRRLFRRALDEREVGVYSAVTQAALDEGETLDAAVGWALRAMLQSPQFVFQLTGETQGVPGEVRALTSLELAARLASFIWDSVPDDALLTAAEDGSLATPAVLDAQVARLLADPKAHRMTEAFIRDFSRAERASFVGATDADRTALRESIVATFQHHVWDANRSLADLFTTREFMLNAVSAELIGAPFTGTGMQLVDVSELPERVGILTHPGSLAGMGDQGTGSFVNRGKYLMERLFCKNPIAVPAALLTALEEFNAETTGLNEHERAAIRKTRVECWSCHTQFEPLAFGFSRLDGAGRYRGEAYEDGDPLTTDGWVPTSTEEASPHYANLVEYMDILKQEPTIQNCMTEHFLSYATAYAPDSLTRSQAPTVGEAYIAGGHTLSAMVVAVTQSDVFRKMLVQDPGTGSSL
jgi:Protein of unknown function (DUF1592)/Protein of unknown function (DUF1588)/Protein of unknown function (DUF1595)/Protein of unknown function (DUF1585)/Protein of unknown function (DUF1587)